MPSSFLIRNPLVVPTCRHYIVLTEPVSDTNPSSLIRASYEWGSRFQLKPMAIRIADLQNIVSHFRFIPERPRALFQNVRHLGALHCQAVGNQPD